MATFRHPKAKLSNPGLDQEVRGAGYNGVRIETFELEVTTAQLAIGSVHEFAKFNDDTVILGGWVEFDELDTNGSPAFEYDIGYIDDSANDDPDAFLNSGVVAGGGPANVVLTTGIGTGVATFLPADDWVLKGTVIAAPATAAAGTIKLCVLLADRSSTNEAAE